uniref:RAP domain-containing protein n=1 Tax=Tetradesmus obliquus TaxID=3088 RepID=A0A383VGT6_TETOB|eukprot:jgi/Sobl393_1/2335/SZX64717.1
MGNSRGSGRESGGKRSWQGGSSSSSSSSSSRAQGQAGAPSKGLSSQGITDAVTACTTPQELVQVIEQNIDNMTAYNLPAAIWKLSKLSCGDPQPYAACVQQYMRLYKGDSARHLSNAVYGLCTAPAAIIRQHQAALQQQLVPAFISKVAAANAQDISNVVYGMAVSGQRLPEESVRRLLGAFVYNLRQTTPQPVSNMLWAVATMEHTVPAGQLQQLLDAFTSMLRQAKPQEVSNTIWAVATVGQKVPARQLQQLLGALVSMLQQAKSQDISNTLWAVAKLEQKTPSGQLKQFLGSFVSTLQQATPQNVSNTLLACAKLSFLPQQLLAAPGLAGLLLAGTPQGLANAAWACGQLGHRDEQLMGALLAEVTQRLGVEIKSSHSTRCNSQNLYNMCWAVAVLDLQQRAQQVLQLAQACSSTWGDTAAEEQRQLWQVHTWLLDFQLAGGQGLQGSLTEQQLQQCEAAWQQQMQHTSEQQHSEFQRSVFASVQRLPITWQQQPQMEQLSVGRDGVTPDGALLLDIAGRTVAGVLVAVEADGPTHFREPDRGLMGTTQYRNRALAVRGYRLGGVVGGSTAAQPDTKQATGPKPQQQQQQQQQQHQQTPVRAAARALLEKAGLPGQGTSQQPTRQRRRRSQPDS